MIVSKSDNTLLIKTKEALIKLNDSVVIGDFHVPGPGEYDVSSIGAQVLPTDIKTTILRAEGMSVLYLDHPYKVDKDDDNFSNIDVVAVRVADKKELSEAEQVNKDLEPRGMVFFGSMKAAEIISELKLNGEPQEKFTVSETSLPEEGTDITVLA